MLESPRSCNGGKPGKEQTMSVRKRGASSVMPT